MTLDELKEVSDTAQVLDKNYEVYQKDLDVYSIHSTTTGEDIFNGIQSKVQKIFFYGETYKCVTIDAKNMWKTQRYFCIRLVIVNYMSSITVNSRPLHQMQFWMIEMEIKIKIITT